METEKLIEKALTNLMGEYTDNGRAQALALIAIANELKRMNDAQEEQFAHEERVADMKATRELYSQ